MAEGDYRHIAELAVSLAIGLLVGSERGWHTREIGAGILLACATMFARVVVVIGVIRPTLIPDVLTPMALGFFTLLGLALWRYRSGRGKEPHQEIQVKNPFQLIPAIQFGALLGAVMLLAQALRAWLGDAGLYCCPSPRGSPTWTPSYSPWDPRPGPNWVN